MNLHLHVFYTWLLAHLLHPLLWYASSFFIVGKEFSDPGILAIVTIIGVVGSLPALFVNMGILAALKRSTFSAITKATAWLAALIGTVVISFLLTGLCLGFGNDILMILPYTVPALLAVTLAFFLRLQQLAVFLTPPVPEGETLQGIKMKALNNCSDAADFHNQ